MNKLLLLPSARLIPSELRTDFGDLPSGMVPLNSRPALHHIAQPYAAAGFEILIAVHERGEAVIEYVSRCPDLRARTLDVGPTLSIAETVATALHSLPCLPDRLVVNFADTLLGEIVDQGDAICYQEREDLYRWTAFEFDDAGMIRGLFEKDQIKSTDSALPVFVGVFSFSDPRRLLLLLDRCVASGDGYVDPFWTALLQYHNGSPANARNLKRVDEWRDFGHLDTYYATQRSFFLNKRSFNSISVDLGRGVVRKSSTHAAKLADEIGWYASLPSALQYLGPRVFTSRREEGETSAEMEFYGYPALNDVYLFGEWNSGIWSQVFQAIGSAIDGMREYEASLSPLARREALRAMYETKTADRLRGVFGDCRFDALTGDRVAINGRTCFGLRGCLDLLPVVLQKSAVYDVPEFTIIHGDLCLSNILYDRRSGFVRLIDPRGSFGESGMYGDPRYDLAKLSHSLLGDYDFYVNGLFQLEITPESVLCIPFRRRSHEIIRRLFRNWLLRREGDRYQQIRLIESLLFLSMVPLHEDRPQSQLAFLTRGLELFQDAVEARTEISMEVSTDVAIRHKYRDHNGR